MKKGDKFTGYYGNEYEVVEISRDRCFIKKSNGEIFSFNMDLIQRSIDEKRVFLTKRQTA